MLYKELFQIAENLKSIAYFVRKSRNENSHDIKISDLNDKADALLDLVRDNKSKINAIESLLLPGKSYEEGQYLAGSKISAVNKGHEVLRKIDRMGIDVSNYGFISLGGGDGTELYTEIENSAANYG